MAHVPHQQVSAKMMMEFTCEMKARGQKVEAIRTNSKETLTYTQGATISYRKKKRTLAIQGKNETVQEINCLFCECQRRQWEQEHKQRQDEVEEAEKQLSQRQQEMSELIVYIMEWTSKHKTKERRRRILMKGEGRKARGERVETYTTTDERCGEILISEFKSALLGQICSKMPQSIA